MNTLAAYLPTDSEHHWGSGCSKCSYGIQSPPDPTPALPLHECRAGQMAEDMLLFCDCRAGFMARQFLRRVYNGLSLAARLNVREHVCAAMPAPTIHLEVTP